ncbi:DUF3299 domain-containing protein [Lacihabitans sp. CCS-44]|jgi:hypothetical protein|uniref:DUF3299 domain-containing protein n=1 Tax=Lacihabitans sp. CCS-44 TaxID=2487331 RepID=UPI0020CB9D76|nr:DUF3299 domain-containing protein [Lacihabitans sp. CCS-44]MCP9754524.1 DUF3299 domain-containing protein [Lacihabitans sp. CCS-44]
MKKNLTFIFLLLAIPVLVMALAPIKITWENLRDVTFKKKWNASENMFVLEPQFGAKVNALKGKEVALTGYMIPVDVDANYYVLSANPFASCFFCGQAGPESVVSVKFKKVTKRFDTDDRLTIKGIFTLNTDDINELNYIIDKAEVEL